LQTDIGTGDAITHPSILQSTIHKNLRKLTISTTGHGERDLFLSYVVEAPVWKTTYRVVLDSKSKSLLRGWTLVDNLQDEDWNDVTLSITRDQERMRENLRALGKTDEEKQLVQRYVAKIAQGEDQLERLRQEEKKSQDQRNNLQRQLDERVKKLAMDHRLN
jgi:hypothetical protein